MDALKIKRLVLGMVRTNCYIIYNDKTKEGIIIDPASESNKISDFVTEEKIQIKGIFLTHGHFDHIGGVCKYRDMYKVKVYCHEEESDIASSRQLNLAEAFGDDVAVKPDELLRDKETLEMCGFNIKVIHTPGHTKGSCCYLISEGEDKILISGDTLFAGSHGRTDFPTGSMAQIRDSIVNKLLCLDENIIVYPGHELETSIGDEKPLWRLS